MPTSRQTPMVELPTGPGRGSWGYGRCDYSGLKKAYPGSPMYTTDSPINDESVTRQFTALTVDNTTGDDGHTFGAVDLNYGAAPDLASVAVGGGGLPGSPYGPNIASPPSGQNPRDIPASGVEATQAAAPGVAVSPPNGSAPFSGDGFANPKDTSLVISGQRIGSLRKGSSTPLSSP